MPCLNQRTIVNRHYVKIAGSASQAEVLFKDSSDLYLVVDCGRCINCQKKRANYWRQRLIDEFRYLVDRNPDKKHRVFFVTLTIAPEFYKKDVNYAYGLIKKFRERYRKTYGKSLRFWICSEYGEKRGRLHFHGIFFDPLFDATLLPSLWKYGRCDMSVVGCSPKNLDQDPEKAIVYVTKYVTKYCDQWFIDYDKRSRFWCSPGLGLAYCFDKVNRDFHSQHGGLYFRLTDDYKFPVALNRYYISKLFSPLDLHIRAKKNIERLHQPLQFPIKVGNLMFNDFTTYTQYLRSIGGNVCLLSQSFEHLSPSEKLTYLNYEQ